MMVGRRNPINPSTQKQQQGSLSIAGRRSVLRWKHGVASFFNFIENSLKTAGKIFQLDADFNNSRRCETLKFCMP
jgi:hypothetical protein